MRKSSETIAEDLSPIAVRALQTGDVDIAGAPEFDGVKGRLAMRVDPLFDPDHKSTIWADLPSTIRASTVNPKN